MLKRVHPFIVPLIGLGVFFSSLLPARGAEPEADPVQAFRQRLADPERLAVRDGDELDLEAVVLQMEAFLDEHGALLRRRFATSLEDIPRGEMPDRQRLLERSDEQVLLLADYGGQDLFIAKLVPHQGIWIAETIAWWRPKKKAAQK